MKAVLAILCILVLATGVWAEKFKFADGSLTTSSLDPWGGVRVSVYPVVFDVDAAGSATSGSK
jgi:hypothetical protein